MKKLLLFLCISSLLVSCAKDASADLQSGKSGSITRFAVYQHYMYVLNLNEVQTYDIQDQAHPVLLNRLATDYGLETITIYDNTVFLGSSTALYILDISKPEQPQILSKTDRPEYFSGCDPVVVTGNTAYSTIKIVENHCGLISSRSALLVYDITVKAAPVQIGEYPLGIPNGLAIAGNYLFVCDEGSDQLVIFDISNPAQLVQTDYPVPITDPYDLIVDGDRLIVSAKTDFEIFDIADLTHVRKLAAILK